MNSFTDPTPSFPYRSGFALAQLGVPESAEIHLAITELAEQLLPIADASRHEARTCRITALRTASAAVLFGWPRSATEQELRSKLEIPLLDGIALPEHRITNEHDWLAEAVHRLRSEGFDVGPFFQRQRSNYGWRELPSQEDRGAPAAPRNS